MLAWNRVLLVDGLIIAQLQDGAASSAAKGCLS